MSEIQAVKQLAAKTFVTQRDGPKIEAGFEYIMTTALGQSVGIRSA